MPVVTRQNVIDMAPELGSIPDGPRWTLAIADAEVEAPESVWAERRALGVRLLVAHRLTLGRIAESGISGRVTSESAGPLSRSYASPAAASKGDDGDLPETVYGRIFLKQMRMMAPRMAVL